jgi:hypothetical protein
MGLATTIEITFVAVREVGSTDSVPAEGVVRMPDDTLRPFCGWIDLLATLEHVAASTRINS